jgi:protein-tyrosine phosphatase
VVSGDLHHKVAKAKEQLEAWQGEGITHIIDCRHEWNDESLVQEYGGGIEYFWHGTHDSGGSQQASWYKRGWDFYEEVTENDPNAKVLVHCHMGINRAPSMAFYLMIREGYEPAEALHLIRTNRPIAACLYADSAWRTFAEEENLSEEEMAIGLRDISEFFADNQIDPSTAIRQIRQVERLENN